MQKLTMLLPLACLKRYFLKVLHRLSKFVQHYQSLKSPLSGHWQNRVFRPSIQQSLHYPIYSLKSIQWTDSLFFQLGHPHSGLIIQCHTDTPCRQDPNLGEDKGGLLGPKKDKYKVCSLLDKALPNFGSQAAEDSQFCQALRYQNGSKGLVWHYFVTIGYQLEPLDPKWLSFASWFGLPLHQFQKNWLLSK